jgi:hypothetical protein
MGWVPGNPKFDDMDNNILCCEMEAETGSKWIRTMICWWSVSCKTPSLGWTESCAAQAQRPEERYISTAPLELSVQLHLTLCILPNVHKSQPSIT